MLTTFGRRAAVAVAAVAVTTAGAPAVASADTTTHTSLSIRAARTAIDAGGQDRVSTVLLAAGHALSGATVVLESRPAGASAFHDVATATTASAGGAAFVVRPEKRTAYEIVFRGGNGYAPSHSGVVTVAVHPDTRPATSLSIRASRNDIDPGQQAVVSGVLRSRGAGLGGRVVVLESRHTGDSAWSVVRSKRTGRHGFVAFVVRPSQPTRYQLVFRSHPYYRASHSGVVHINVRIPVTLSVAAAAASISPGGSDRISGVLATASGPLSGRTVALLARPVGASRWAKLATTTSAADGSVSFPVTPAKTTRYLLSSARAFRYTAVRSAVVTVVVRAPSSLSIRLSANGQSVAGTLLGQGGTALAGRTVTLESRPAGTGTFAPAASATTDRSGHVAFAVAPSSSTDYQLAFEGGSRYDGCRSGVVTVTVA